MALDDRLPESAFAAFRRARHESPRQRIRLVQRPHLISQLSEALERRLCVVAAPAGFGKTTLLTQWREQLLGQGARVAWLSLDEEDRDVRHFLAGLIFALDAAQVDIGQLLTLAEMGLMEHTPSAVVARLNTVVASQPGRVVLILDDYHRAQSREVNEAVNRLLTDAPDNLTLVINARTRPSALMVKWLAADDAIEVGAHDLRFSREEAREIFEAPIASDTFNAVFEQTEGWAIALQLARLVAERAPESLAANPLSGSGDHLAAYLADQVLAELPPEIHDFMLFTALFDRFNADLANSALERRDAGSILERMRPLNSILVSLDDGQAWFRYHHLVADCLQAMLRMKEPERIAPVLLRASRWFELHGDSAEAVRYAAMAGDYQRCASLIEDAGAWRLVLYGGIGRLRSLLRHVPEHILPQYPRVLVARAYLALKDGEVTRASALVASARKVARSRTAHAEHTALDWDLLAVGALLDGYEDHFIDAAYVEVMRRTREAADPDDSLIEAVFFCTEAIAQLSLGAFEAAWDVAHRAGYAMRRAQSVPGLNYCYLHSGFADLSRGRLRDAEASFQEAARLAQENLGADSGLRALAVLSLNSLSMWRSGWTEAEWTRFADAFDHVETYDGWFEVYATGLETASFAADTDGDVEALRRQVDAAYRIARTRGGGRLADLADVLNLMLQGRLRDDAAAERLARALKARLPIGCWRASPFLWRPYIHAGLALAEWSRRTRTGTGLAEIDDVLACCRAFGADLFAVRALVAKAELLEQAGRRREAIIVVGEAARLAAPEEIAGPFLAPQVCGLLHAAHRQALDAGDEASARFITHCLRRNAPMQLHDASGADLFSRREHEVLLELTRGASNKLIARALDMTEHTVKFHLHNIFRKLGVESRGEAVAMLRSQAAPAALPNRLPDRMVR
ncbi:MAG: LuxR C-terminal-related transcriptional regulator [Caulobacteraceae bacterium]|nr:LuxR C-terminal-related transcriptional regulator [Caulobacteraceae bacterium]